MTVRLASVCAAVAFLMNSGCGANGKSPVVSEAPAASPSRVTIDLAPAPIVPGSVSIAGARCVFRDVTEGAGVTFSYYNGAHGQMHIRETMGGGVGLIDFDLDGWLDLYFTNGCDMSTAGSDLFHSGQLFRNRHDGSFEQVTDLTRIADLGYGQGCSVGDCNNDGFGELVVTHDGAVSLFWNNGDGTFVEAGAQCGVASSLWNTASALGDLFGTGQLDIFVTGYLEVSPSGDPICRDRRGKPAYCGPEHFAGQSYRLFQNEGDGSFLDVSRQSGVIVPRSKGLAAVILDLDGDGPLDIFVVNDAEPARFFHNEGGGRFRDTASVMGLAFNGNGQVYNGMGIGQGDYDGDGQIDLLVSNFYEKGVLLFRKLNDSLFRDESIPSRIGPPTRPYTSFGLDFTDVDNDGWLDAFVANGHISDLRADGIPYAMKPQLFRNQGNGRFQDISAGAGSYFDSEHLGRGVAVGDLDRDGGDDLVISHNMGPVSLLHNETSDRGHYLTIDLVGTRSSRTAFGARVTATLGDRRVVRMLGGGGSYLSARDQRILLGLGDESTVSSLEVHWPSGGHDRSTNLPGDTAIRLVESR